MNGQPPRFEASVRALRIIHLALFVPIPLYFLMGETVGPREPSDVRLIRQVITALALLDTGLAVVFRKRMVEPAAEALRLKPDDTVAMARWAKGHILSFAICESVGLFGLVLRFLGATTLEAAPFFAVAFVLMLVFRPSAP